MMRQVLLINPAMTSPRNARFPLAVLTLSASLDGKYPSRIIDGNIDPRFIATTLRLLQEGSVAAAGITVMGGPQLRSAVALSKAIRENFPMVPIIWGGAFPTVCPEAALNAPYVDYAIRAQGEQTLLELLEALTAGKNSVLDSIAGLSWRSSGQVVHNKDRQPVAHAAL
jgi:radical SAM superfamily enzyme YgiQ (UPF0313 family)